MTLRAPRAGPVAIIIVATSPSSQTKPHRAAAMQAGDRIWLLHRVDEPFRSQERGSRLCLCALAAARQSLGRSHSESSALVGCASVSLCASPSASPYFVSKLARTKGGDLSERFLSAGKTHSGAASGNTQKWDFPLLALPDHSKTKPKSGISHLETR